MPTPTKTAKPFADLDAALDLLCADELCSTIETATDEIRNAESVESLRHTFACHALAAGADLQAVSKLLGHSNVAVTAASYCHLLPGADRQAVAKLETFATAPSAATVTDLAHARARLRGEQGERS